MTPIDHMLQSLLDATPPHPLDKKVTRVDLKWEDPAPAHEFYAVLSVLDSENLTEQQIAERIRERENRALEEFNLLAKDEPWTLTYRGPWFVKRASQFLHCPNRGDGAYYFRKMALMDASGIAQKSPHHGES